MITGRHKSWFLITILLVMSSLSICEEATMEAVTDVSEDSHKGGNAEARSLFSPRVDYNEWMPVGRGDPLKNDPTYDYSPPVLDRVRYWGDTNKDKNEILLLGVPSKRQSGAKKETKFNSIRRNYYPQLPTRLMPPPMQTITPNTNKQSSTENYSGAYQQNSYRQPPSQTWGSSNSASNYVDSHSDESINLLSLSRPVSNPNLNKSTQNDIDPRPHFTPQTPSKPRKPWLHSLLQKEVTKPATDIVLQPSKSIYESHSSHGPIAGIFNPTTETSTYFQPTIPPASTGMTTDSLFSHYKQPDQPLHGPMYLIIEGHSKVKTYGLKDNYTKQHQPKIVPVPVKDDAVINHVVSKDETGKTLEVKHIYQNSEDNTENPKDEEEAGMDGLLSLLDSSLGNFFAKADEENKKKNQKNLVKIQDSEREGRQIFDYDQLPEDRVEEDTEKITVEPRSAYVTIENELEVSTEMS